MSGFQTISGGCHCGALRYRLEWPSPGSDSAMAIVARRCTCTFCTRIDGAWTSHPTARLNVSEDPASPASRYRFGTGTADFLFCSRCGITPLVTCELDGQLFAVVNVNTFDEESRGRIELGSTGTRFDNESTDDRLARRRQGWIGHVTWDKA